MPSQGGPMEDKIQLSQFEIALERIKDCAEVDPESLPIRFALAF